MKEGMDGWSDSSMNRMKLQLTDSINEGVVQPSFLDRNSRLRVRSPRQ